MKFFVDEGKRKTLNSTYYLEFQKGFYHNKCWLPDSISIRGDLWDEYHLSDLIRCIIKEFDYYGITVVTKNQWDEIVQLGQKSSTVWDEIVAEAVPWADGCFAEHDAFTIIGL